MKQLNNNSLISIIVGIHNGAKHLKECLDSIVMQDYQNLEILLIDDGSKDSSGKTADLYSKKDARVRVFHRENSGVSNSRNYALNIARGEYVCILDQDDVIAKDYVSYFFRLCTENNAEIALTPSVDKFMEFPHEQKIKKEKIQIWSNEQAIIEMLYHKIVIAPWNKMIKRSLIEDNQIHFNPAFFNGEGFAFSIECFQAATCIAVGTRKVYHYRVGDPTTGASVFKREYIESSLNAQQYIKRSLLKKTPEIVKAWSFSNWHTHCDALNIMVGCEAVDRYRDLYDEIRNVCCKEALCALNAPVSIQQKLRGILFRVNPYLASKIINHFRIRKFAKIDAKQ